MSLPPDGCLQRAGRQKTASSATIYIMEELGDARLHCAQLTHYVDLARQIIEKSEAKDHLFEVAGHLIQAIPEHLFKLEKSLQAVALAADRMDYEEIKQELKPEKVEELERVLKQVRIRHVPHRSEPRPPMNPTQAAESLQRIATEIRTTGKLPVAQVLDLVAGLEGQDRTASDLKATADVFEEMGKALLTPSPEAPKRLHLAATLRKALADNIGCGDVMDAGALEDPVTSAEEAARRSRFEKGQPADPTQNMSPEDAEEWKAKNEEHKDNFKEASASPAVLRTIVRSLAMTTKDLATLGNFFREVASLQGQMRVLERAMPKDVVFASKEAALDPGPMPRMEMIKSDTIVAYRRGVAGNWRMALSMLTGTVENIGALLNELGQGTDGMAKAALLNREIYKAKRAIRPSDAELNFDPRLAGELDNPMARHEEGKPVDPTKDMSPEDAKEWKLNTLKHKDEFKKDAIFRGSPALFLNQVEAAGDVLGQARMLTRRIWETLGELARDATGTTQFSDIYEDPDIRRVEKTLYNLDHAMGQGIDGVEFIGQALKKKLKTAGELDNPMARHEEGKPADPTKDMSPEDAEEWKLNTLKHKDKFKEADWKAAAGDQDLKTALARLSVAKKAEASVSVSEAEKLASSAMHLYKEAHDLFDEAHRTKADYYNPIDPTLAGRLKDLHGEVVRGLSALSRIDSKGAAPILTKDLSTFGHMNLSPDTLSEAAGLAYVINNKALLVLHKARRAVQQVRFYTNWVGSYKATGSSPPLEDQWEWLRTADDADWKVTAKLQSRQEKILRKYLDMAGLDAAKSYDELPPDVQADLRRVKDQETLWSDVDRWLMDNNNPHLRTGW